MYTNETPNYDLPQYVEGDNFDAISDMNPAFETIDRAMKENAVNATSAINLVKETAENAQNAAIDAQRALNNAQAAAMSAQEAKDILDQLNPKVEGLDRRLSEAESTIVAAGDRMIDIEGDIDALKTADNDITASYKNADIALEQKINKNGIAITELQESVINANSLATEAKTTATSASTLAEDNKEKLEKIKSTIQFTRSMKGNGTAVNFPQAASEYVKNGGLACALEIADSMSGTVVGVTLITLISEGSKTYTRRFLISGNVTAQYTITFEWVEDDLTVSVVDSTWTSITPDLNLTFLLPARWN